MSNFGWYCNHSKISCHECVVYSAKIASIRGITSVRVRLGTLDESCWSIFQSGSKLSYCSLGELKNLEVLNLEFHFAEFSKIGCVRFLVDTLLVHSVRPSVISFSPTHHISNQKGDLCAKSEKWHACSLGCVHPIWNPFRTRYRFSSTSIPGPKDILSLKVCSSWGMMGMSTDQIAEVFTMDAAEVVKILERAERSTSKDGVDMGNKMSF